MPLSPAAPRKRLHERTARYEGFARDDGLFDVEAHLTDVKDHDLTLLTGVRRAGEPVHDMWVRLTIDAAMTIVDIEAQHGRGAVSRRLRAHRGRVSKAGRREPAQGFRKTLHDTFGGVHGCTHLTELLGYLPTAAVQMFAGLQEARGRGRGQAVPARPLPRARDDERRRAPLLSEVVSRRRLTARASRENR